MKFNDKKLDINDLTKDVYNDKTMIKMRGNGIYLSDNQIEVLKRYDIVSSMVNIPLTVGSFFH